MHKNLQWRILAVLGVVALSAWYAFPLSKRINLGLDLQGGMHLILRVCSRKRRVVPITVPLVPREVTKCVMRSPKASKISTPVPW